MTEYPLTVKRGEVDVLSEKATWNIWSYVRRHCRSMDSGSACDDIRKHIDAVVAVLQRKIDDLQELVDAEKLRCEQANKSHLVTKRRLRAAKKLIKQHGISCKDLMQ